MLMVAIGVKEWQTKGPAGDKFLQLKQPGVFRELKEGC